MAKKATTLIELAKVRADKRELLNAIVGTQGTALGRKNFDLAGNPEGNPCIIVYVPHKINNALLSENIRIPPVLITNNGELEAPTDVVVTTTPTTPKPTPTLNSENETLVRKLQWRDSTLNHVPSGVQVGFAHINGGNLGAAFGTIGYAVRSRRDPKRIGFLTNQHVGVHPGHSLYIPGYDQQALRVGITRNVLEYLPDDHWLEGIDEPFAYVRTDAAFVEAEPSIVQFLRNTVPGIGQIGEPYEVVLSSMDIIGKPVKKVGRTTGLQHGTVVSFGYGFETEEEFIDRRVGREPANFYTDLLIAPRFPSTVFSAPGDSGSAILLDTNDDDNNRPVGLLWGGWPGDVGRGLGFEDLTYGISLTRILKAMELELHSQQ